MPGGPTGIVWNGTAGAFPITGGQSTFIFNTMSGQISGWRGALAEVKVTKPSSFYLGMTLAVTATGPQLYSTDFKGNKIDVVNGSWADVDTTGKFVDPTLPAGYGPYGIQTVGNRIFVTYAEHVQARTTRSSRARARATSARSTSRATSSRASRPAAC